MAITYNIYCDESCHLENDNQKAMVLGAVWCPTNKVHSINKYIRMLKEYHGLKKDCELKWTKISPSKKKLYIDLVKFFFENDDLHFRTLIIPDKSKLRHKEFNHTHDTWYYKMYFDMLKAILTPNDCYRIYLDIKDNKSHSKVEKLHEVLSNNLYDFNKEIVERVQNIRSHEVEILQLTDVLIGAVSYTNRDLTSSLAKNEIIDLIKRHSNYSLTRTTLLRENKFNIFRWNPQEVE